MNVNFTATASFGISNKNDLKKGDIVTLRNGDKLMYVGEEAYDNFIDLSEGNDNYLTDLSDLNDDMTMSDRDYRDSDIVNVDRAFTYTNVFEREEETREMTLEEICKELGYNVKIVKEEE